VNAHATFHRYEAQANQVLLCCGAVGIGLLLSFCTPAAGAQASAPQSSDKVSATVPDMGPPVRDNQIFAHALLNQFEGRTNGPDNVLRWDGEAWIGTDTNRLWLKSEGFSN
jgi:copper resistance protein B